jgi:acyl-[acyl-carrier-protein] desaturase
MTDAELLQEIEPTLQQNYDDHMKTAHKLGRPFDTVAIMARATGTEPDPLVYGAAARESFQAHVAQFGETYGVDIRPVLAASFLVNLLTEDNLPHYTSRIHSKVGASPALMAFANEWTAEEDSHGEIMRDYALLSGLIGRDEFAVIDGKKYHQGRVSQLREGTEIDPPNMFDAFSYLSLQEHLTKEAHIGLRWLLDNVGVQIMSPISGDEQNHYEFYVKALQAAASVDPDTTLVNMHAVFSGFEMPGKKGIPRFAKHALNISLAGIFDLETIAQSKRVIADRIQLANAAPQSDNGKQAQEELLVMTSDKAIADQRNFMEGLRDSQPATNRSGLSPFILGRTIDYKMSDSIIPRITGFQSIQQ